MKPFSMKKLGLGLLTVLIAGSAYAELGKEIDRAKCIPDKGSTYFFKSPVPMKLEPNSMTYRFVNADQSFGLNLSADLVPHVKNLGLPEEIYFPENKLRTITDVPVRSFVNGEMGFLRFKGVSHLESEGVYISLRLGDPFDPDFVPRRFTVRDLEAALNMEFVSVRCVQGLN